VFELRTQPVSRKSAAARPKQFNAPLFKSIMERLNSSQRWVVLELGAARARTVSLLSQYRCRLDVADLIDGVDRLNAEHDPANLQHIAEAMLPLRRSESTDAVLCWDILNYLEPPALTALMTCVAERARPGTLVHTLIVYSEPHMARLPGQFSLTEDHSLVDTAISRADLPAPRYSPSDLTDRMPGYSIDRAMLLGNGMQEILFRL
jgi:hypothetical protein